MKKKKKVHNRLSDVTLRFDIDHLPPYSEPNRNNRVESKINSRKQSSRAKNKKITINYFNLVEQSTIMSYHFILY